MNGTLRRRFRGTLTNANSRPPLSPSARPKREGRVATPLPESLQSGRWQCGGKAQARSLPDMCALRPELSQEESLLSLVESRLVLPHSKAWSARKLTMVSPSGFTWISPF